MIRKWYTLYTCLYSMVLCFELLLQKYILAAAFSDTLFQKCLFFVCLNKVADQS